MSAYSVSGVGQGSSKKVTTKELATLANGPVTVLTGTFDSTGGIATSPPSSTATVLFPKPLEGTGDNYVVMLTSQNAGYAYVFGMNNSGGQFIGFDAVTQYEGTVMYLVARIGMRPGISEGA